MSKKFLAKLLIFCMVFTMLPMSAFAAVQTNTVTGTDKAVYTVTADTAKLEVEVGKTVAIKGAAASYEVTYTVGEDTKTETYATTVEYTSKAPTTASVNANGVVTGLAAGETTIVVWTQTTGKDIPARLEIPVTVKNPAGNIPVTGITLDKTAVDMLVGDSVKLQATVTPTDATDATVTWSKPEGTYVVRVDAEGNIYALSVGTTVVTAKAGDKTATCTVTVLPSIQEIVVTPEKITAVIEDNVVKFSGNAGTKEIIEANVYTNGAQNPRILIKYVGDKFEATPTTFVVGKTTYTVDVTGVQPEKAVVVEPQPEGAVAENVPENVKPALEASVAALENGTYVYGVQSIVAGLKQENKDGSVVVNGTTVSAQAIADKVEEKGWNAEQAVTLVVPVPTFTAKGATINEETGKATTLVFDIKLVADVKVAPSFEQQEDAVTVQRIENIPTKDNDRITITLPLAPNVMTVANRMFVKHTKAANTIYNYLAHRAYSGNAIEFTTLHGFSEFEISKTGNYVAVVDGELYATLQAAVDAVANNGIIELLKDGTAEVKKAITFDVWRYYDGGTHPANIKATITAGDGYEINTSKSEYDAITGEGRYVVEAKDSTPPGSSGGSSSNVSIATKVTGGKVTVTPTRPTRGQTVTINVTANEGYKLDTLVVTDNKGNNVELTKVSDNKYTFVMPAGKVTVTPTFVKTNATDETKDPAAVKRFSDVASGAWYAEYITYVTENALMNGYDDGRFGPNDQTTRAQIVTVLYRLEGEPATRSSNSFSDVSAGGQYYSSAVAWAAINNIVNGYEDGRFGPNDNVTREQIAAILYRYATYKGYDTENAGSIANFSDAAKVSSWANTAISWAVGEGLMNGDNGALRPQGNATRAEIAALLMRFAENIAK